MIDVEREVEVGGSSDPISEKLKMQLLEQKGKLFYPIANLFSSQKSASSLNAEEKALEEEEEDEVRVFV